MKGKLKREYIEKFFERNYSFIESSIREYLKVIIWNKTENEYRVVVKSSLIEFDELNKMDLRKLIEGFFNEGKFGGKVKKLLYSHLSDYKIESSKKNPYLEKLKEMLIVEFDYQLQIVYNEAYMGHTYIESIPQNRLNFSYDENKNRYKKQIQDIMDKKSKRPASDSQIEYIKALFEQHGFVLTKKESELNSQEVSSLISFIRYDTPLTSEEEKLFTYK